MIKVLDKNIADKIAAGEVIDRPVSIIKELVENSLDAGADNITIEIKNGGKSYIRVSDNGCGIPGYEAEIAFRRHATSKISDASDLDAINTLGFRGEALASICAVSRVEMITKTAEQKTGQRIIVEGSDTIINESIGCPEGTTITVKDLFYNVPARKKFLSSDATEARHIIDIVSRLALGYSDIKLTLINNGKTVFTTQGRGNIKNNIINIYGNDIAMDLLPVHNESEGFIIKGFVSSPQKTLASRAKQIFCVNGRIITSRVIEKSIELAYREKLFSGRFPLTFLFIYIPPDKLDVNIHPTKKEIRFDDAGQIEKFISESIKTALIQKAALPQIHRETIKNYTAYRDTDGSVNECYDVKAEKHDINYGKTDSENRKEEHINVKELLSTLRRRQESENEEAIQENIFVTGGFDEGEQPADSQRAPLDFDRLNYGMVLFNTYITAADGDNFYLIDQHAAHERVFYEKFMKQYENSEKLRQSLLIPHSFNVSSIAYTSQDFWLPQMRDLGYELEEFGDKVFILREIPAFMDESEAIAFINDVVSGIETDVDMSNKEALSRIISRACKSAVKGGCKLHKEEVLHLIDELKSCDNPFSCPHGRPTFIRLSRYEIEKMFKRV